MELGWMPSPSQPLSIFVKLSPKSCKSRSSHQKASQFVHWDSTTSFLPGALRRSHLGGRVACGNQFSMQYLECVWPLCHPLVYPRSVPCGPVERGLVYVSTARKQNSSQRA